MCGWSFFSLEIGGRFRCRLFCYSGKRDMHPWCPKDQRQNYSLPSSIILTISTNAHWLTTCRSISITERGKICETKKTCLLKAQWCLGYGFPIIKSADILLTPFLGLHLVLFKGLHWKGSISQSWILPKFGLWFHSDQIYNYFIIIKTIIMDIHIKMGFATYFPEEDVIIKIQWFEQTKYAYTGY